MSTTGDLTVVDKGHEQVIPTGTTQTPIRLTDAAQGIVDEYAFAVAEGRTFFDLQVYATFSSTVASRPTRIIVELCRYKPDGTKDPTAKSVRAIIQPGTTSWSDVFPVAEFVSLSDGRYGYTISHNGTASIRLTTRVFKAHNPSAYAAARLTPAAD